MKKAILDEENLFCTFLLALLIIDEAPFPSTSPKFSGEDAESHLQILI